jgi:hypothetical protein
MQSRAITDQNVSRYELQRPYWEVPRQLLETGIPVVEDV